MAFLTVVINSNDTPQQLVSRLDAYSDKWTQVNSLVDYVSRVKSGTGSGAQILYRVGDGDAYGTVTFSGNPSNGQTITVDGYVFTAETSGANGYNQFNIGSDAYGYGSATNFAAAVNATYIPITAFLGGSYLSPVVTLTADMPGALGNSITLTKTASNVVVSGSTFSGGSDNQAWASNPLSFGK